ncbi:BACON domain-containing protein [Sphingobacterium chuzhouense]|uniref:BACON domain-containing protein n=1 Tax=Sphingobacterium chuzhouense TaxID=1742264 RepID=A0ABR7XW65_9SPHI|nr:BACON domain-containing protein [Sphingobacterium chuzhouense]MBD1423285.1 BACON domain-containing protein [Sphingobacterium chuzhouense]
MKKCIILLLILPLFLQCQKKMELDLSLAVNSNELHLTAEEGTTHIMVYADGEWEVNFKEDADWISVDKVRGSGNSDVVFSYAQNFGASRRVTLVLSKGSEKQEVLIIQEGLEVALRFAKNKFTIPKHGLPTILPIVSNVEADFKSVDIEYLYDDETSEQWVTNGALTDEGFTFEALENTAGRKRSVRIYLTLVDAFDNEYMSFADVDQTVDEAFLVHKHNTATRVTRSAKLDTVILSSNIGTHFPNIEKNVTYEQGNDWIEEVTLINDSLLILAIRENNSGLERNANVGLKLAINGVNLVELTHPVFQSAEDFEEYTFEELRGLIVAASGTATINAPLKVLQGIVISDQGNANMETNPNLAYNRMDLTETYRTAYIQSLDGKYGFRLKFTAESENTLKRYSKVNIAVDELTLEKEANPMRYTITGIRSGNIVKSEAGTASNVVNKLKYISELSDADMYTQVTLRDVSISIPYGSYMNVNAGYTNKTNWNTEGTTTPYLDAIPTNIYDGKGDNMNMLVNANSSWARNAVTKNSGTIAGILTHSKLLRFGGGEGDVGRYTLRPITLGDIRLNNASVAQTLVEWNWLPGGTNTCATGVINKDGAGNVLPFIGTGKMNTTVADATSGVAFHPVCHSNPNSKQVYNNALQYNNVKWWNAQENRGEGIVMQFSTTGITAQTLVLNFSVGGGSGNDANNHIPTYWEVEYSLDGANYTVLPNSTYAVRPLTQWATDRPSQMPALRPLSFKLPASLLGQANVYVKLRAKSDICATGSPTGAETGRITAAMPGTSMRLGFVSINYIQ